MAHGSHTYRADPTTEQAELLARTFGCVRFVGNRGLNGRWREQALNGRKVKRRGRAFQSTNGACKGFESPGFCRGEDIQ